MAKSARSNQKKKLRTQRREAVTEKTAWLQTADEKRQAALAACLGAEPVKVDPIPGVEAEERMQAERPATRVKKVGQLKGIVKKQGKGGKGSKGKKVNALSGKNQFYKKGRKGARV